MKNAMDYEAIDWEAEALRVAVAFRVRGDSEFRRFGFRQMQFLRPHSKLGRVPINADKSQVRVIYDLHQLDYGLQRGSQSASVRLRWDGTLISASNWIDMICAIPLAKSLFNLGLLSGEIESALKVSVTAHQKMEWLREYEERYGL